MKIANRFLFREENRSVRIHYLEVSELCKGLTRSLHLLKPPMNKVPTLLGILVEPLFFNCFSREGFHVKLGWMLLGQHSPQHFL